jgi:tetratricopeptide (TPR) repeat protein
LFGFHTTQVTESDLKDSQSITKPTDSEIRAFSNFAKSLSNRIYLSLSAEQKEEFADIKNGAKQLSDYKRKVRAMQEPFESNALADSPSEKTNLSSNLAANLSYSFSSIVLGSSQRLPIKAVNSVEEDEKEIFDPEALNDITALLYANGFPELAAAVSTMAAAVHPEDPMSALAFGTILREGNADEDAFNALQYALRLSPDSEPILYSLGMCALDLKNTSYAETCFSKILSLNPSSGPGHQGMMLCYMDAENYSSAFLHMIEGAREGYSTMVTETYKALRQRPNEYKEIAKTILDQYTFEQLLDFTKSRTPFDETLDTPEGQLEISRKINLGRDSGSIYSYPNAVQEGMEYALKAFTHGKATLDDAFGLIPGGEIAELIEGLGGLLQQDAEEAPDSLLEPVSKSILERIFNSADEGKTVSNDGWLSISYEAEVFWLNILDDYVQIKLDEILEEYFQKPYDEVFENNDSVTPSLDAFHDTLAKLAEDDPLQAAGMVLNNLVNNNSVYDSGVQNADRNDMDRFLETVNPKLEEGYKKTADLMELYWLHSGSILGQIGNDETYNRYQQHRKTTVASALTPYVAAGSINSFLVIMNVSVVDSDNQSSGGSIYYPPFPDFPDTQMGDRYVPPPPKQTTPDEDIEPQIEDPEQEGDTPQQQETPGEGEDPSSKPDDPNSEKPKTDEIITEDTITLFLGPISLTINQKTGYEVDLTGIYSINLRYDKRTGDLTLFGGVGLSLGAATSGASGRLGIYAVINPRTMSYVQSGTRGTLDGQLAGNGIAVERQISFTTGADTTTVSAILLHKKSSQTTEND